MRHRFCTAFALSLNLVAALVSLLVPSRVALAAPPPQGGVVQSASNQGGAGQTFQSLGFGDQTARGINGGMSYFFPVPRGLVPQPGSEVTLNFSHSPLLLPDRSTLTVSANGQALASVFLTPENRTDGQLVVPLPTESFTGTGYFVEVQLHMRLTHDECEETQNPALWTTVFGTSSLALPLATGGDGPRLQDAQGVFTPSTRQPVTLVAPGTTPEELEAAGLVAYQIGRWAAQSDADAAVTLATAPPADGPSVLVGTGSALGVQGFFGPLTWNGQAFGAPGGPVAAGDGVVATTTLPGSAAGATAARLLVSGATPPAVLEAARALAAPERRALLTGSHTIVTAALVVSAETPPWTEGAASFAQLGIERRQVSGVGQPSITIPFQRPAGWTVEDGSTLELRLQPSPALRADTSWVAASVNGIDVGTKRLEPNTGGVQTVRFALPAGVLNADLARQPQRRLNLQLRFGLELPDAGCIGASEGGAWVAVLPTSAWYLPHSTASGLDLGRFPFPLTGDGARTVVVVPPSPSRDELSAGLQALAALGRWNAAPNTPLPQLITADGFGAAERQANVVLIGGPDRNAASADAAKSAAALFDPAAPAAFRAVNGERRGALRLARSPWSGSRTVLAVLGDDRGVAAAAEALTLGATVSQLRGQAAAIVDQMPPQTVAAATPQPLPPAQLAPTVAAPSAAQRLLGWPLAGAVLLGAALVIVVLVLATRFRARRA